MGRLVVGFVWFCLVLFGWLVCLLDLPGITLMGGWLVLCLGTWYCCLLCLLFYVFWWWLGGFVLDGFCFFMSF